MLSPLLVDGEWFIQTLIGPLHEGVGVQWLLAIMCNVKHGAGCIWPRLSVMRSDRHNGFEAACELKALSVIEGKGKLLVRIAC